MILLLTRQANVYGVLLPNHDGRAGCAAINLDASSKGNFDARGLAAFVRDHLPKYAVPIFIRVMSGEAGGLSSHNNKQDKVKLRDEGIDPARRGTKVPNGEKDQIYWLPAKGTEYVPFKEEDWKKINNGQAKL
jgi:hypothetical protein